MQKKIKSKISRARVKVETLDKIKKEIDKKKQNSMDVVNERRLKDSYVFNFLNGQYWLAEYNFLVLQLNGGSELGTREGVTKTRELILSEAMLFKFRAEKGFKHAYADLVEMKKMGLSDKDISMSLIDFQRRKIKKDQYDLDPEVNISSKVSFG